MNARRWFLPSISLSLWLVFFLGLSLSNWRQVLISADGDPCLHRRIGEWMLEHRQVITHEEFSHTRLGAPLISKEWLGEVLFALATRALDWNGLVFVAAVLIATTLWWLHRQLLGEGVDLLLATGGVLLVALTGSMHWLARPHLWTHLLAVGLAWQLRQYVAGRYSTRQLWFTVPALMLVWANLHGAFFTGFILLGVYFVGALCERRFDRARILAGIGIASLAASLVNPNGWQLHRQILGFLRTPALSGMVNEFRSPNFHSGGTDGLVLLLLVLALTLLIVRARWSPTEILLVGGWGYCALHSVRNVPIFAFVTAPVLAKHVQAFLAGLSAGRRIDLYRRVNARVSALQGNAGGQALFVVAVAGVLLTASQRPTEILPDRFPVAAVAKLASGAIPVNGEVFNDYGWGGYLLWALPERKVFIDGRNDFYGKELVDDFNSVDDVQPGWEGVLEKHRVGWTMLSVKHPLNTVLGLHPGWKKVYVDDVAVIYARR